jgi:hypothetical protein
MTYVAQFFYLHTWAPRQTFCINFDKKWAGVDFGQFFTNTSGHPVSYMISEGANMSRQRIFVILDFKINSLFYFKMLIATHFDSDDSSHI